MTEALHYTGNHARNEKTLASTQPILLDALAAARKAVSDADVLDKAAQENLTPGQRTKRDDAKLAALESRVVALNKVREKLQRVPLKVGMIASTDRRAAIESEQASASAGGKNNLPFDAWYQLNFGERYKRFLTGEGCGVPLHDVHVPRTALLFVKTRFHARHHLHAANVISTLPQRRRIKANNKLSLVPLL